MGFEEYIGFFIIVAGAVASLVLMKKERAMLNKMPKRERAAYYRKKHEYIQQYNNRTFYLLGLNSLPLKPTVFPFAATVVYLPMAFLFLFVAWAQGISTFLHFIGSGALLVLCVIGLVELFRRVTIFKGKTWQEALSNEIFIVGITAAGLMAANIVIAAAITPLYDFLALYLF